MASQVIRQSDGRILFQDAAIQFGSQVETTVFTLDTPDWRDSFDVWLDPNGNNGLRMALVRLYAITLTSRALVARGRLLQARDFKGSVQVLRARGQGAQKFEITMQREPRFGDATADNPTRLAGCAYGLAPSSTLGEALTIHVRNNPATEGGEQVSLLPTSLYGLIASNSTANDRWIMLFDQSSGTPANGDKPVFPELYVPKSGLGAAGLDFGERPFEFVGGLYVAISSTPDTLTTATGVKWDVEIN